ncbi:hypothetical protein [Paenibacillus tepidiphilus]|uniref:hypothetical protein n=1 Tax=Paenibacillus tepidiphilus TaxID=2608683 RepID=UPI0013A54CA1|nr:hypothetical protein [Paenibacillus tepidiphilus]
MLDVLKMALTSAFTSFNLPEKTCVGCAEREIRYRPEHQERELQLLVPVAVAGRPEW